MPSSFDPAYVVWTFDDGPSDHTMPIATMLSEAGLTATFFMLGKHVAERPAMVADVLALGHEVGNHSTSHPCLSRIPIDEARVELAECQEILIDSGAKPTKFRPPYGDTDDAVDAVAAAMGLVKVTWTVECNDWQRPGASAIEQIIREQSVPGSVILLHDGAGDMSGEKADRSGTVEAVRRLISG